MDNSDQQLIALALAELQLRRPGWDYAITECAKRVGVPQALIDQGLITSQGTIVPLETNLLPFLQWLRKEYTIAETDMVESWDGETETYGLRLTVVSIPDEVILDQYHNVD